MNKNDVKTLYRPTGIREMERILDSDSRVFPPRRPEQPIFYPVLNIEYARQIASKWNIKDPNSGYVGFVTEFDMDREYLEKFREQVVGASIHRELWVPAEELEEFNSAIRSPIRIADAFYGELYQGPTPVPTLLKGKNAEEQFPALIDILDYNGMDFICELRANRKVVQMNYKYWVLHDFTDFDMAEARKWELLTTILDIWLEVFPDVGLVGSELVIHSLEKGKS
jgi:hypothetical protein